MRRLIFIIFPSQSIPYLSALKHKEMRSLILPLVDWSNGIVMIGVFAAVCIVLILVLLGFILGKRNKLFLDLIFAFPLFQLSFYLKDH